MYGLTNANPRLVFNFVMVYLLVSHIFPHLSYLNTFLYLLYFLCFNSVSLLCILCILYPYLMCCQGNEISHSFWYDLSKQTNDNPTLFFPSYCDVKESLKKSSNRFQSRTSPGYFSQQTEGSKVVSSVTECMATEHNLLIV